MHVVDIAINEVGSGAIEFPAADHRGAGCLPAAAVRHGRLQNAIDIEQQLPGRDVVDADQVVPDAGRRSARRIGAEWPAPKCCRRLAG